MTTFTEDQTVPKIQWSKFSPDRTEQYVIRTDTWEDLVSLQEKVLGRIPSTEAFPNDEGPIAHTEAQTQQSVPYCGIHKTPMKLRHGKYGDFWSCGTKNADGTWCNFKPKE